MLQHVYVDGATAKGKCKLVLQASRTPRTDAHVRLLLAQDTQHASAGTCQMQV